MTTALRQAQGYGSGQGGEDVFAVRGDGGAAAVRRDGTGVGEFGL